MSGPAYTEVQVLVPAGWHELVAEVLSSPPSTGVAFGPRSLGSAPLPEGFQLVRGFFDQRDDGDELRVRLRGAVSDLARRTGGTCLEVALRR